MIIEHFEPYKKTLATLSFTATPLITSIADEQNRTPKAMSIPMPKTPSTLSVPMQTAMTLAPPPAQYGASSAEEVPEVIEYSFEEIRAGFFLPGTHIKSIIV